MPSVRDWQLHGVTLKVELATSGTLVVGSNQTKFSFDNGGEYGAPLGWDASESSGGNPVGNEGAYNWTTSSGVFSVSAKVDSNKYAGIWSPTFPLTIGRRYQLGGEVRQMAGKAATWRSLQLQYKFTGGWGSYVGTTATALTDWENVLLTGTAIPDGFGPATGRIALLGGPPTAQTTLWGAQFQNLFVNELDQTTEPIVWTDITCDVQSLGIRYGRERFTNRYDVATLQMTLWNPQGKYSYHNPHPLGLQPGRQVRVLATYEGIEYPLAFHLVDSITDGYSIDGVVVSQWQCVDPSTLLSNATVKSSLSGYPTSGYRIGYLADQVGYLPRLLDVGAFQTQRIIANGRSVRDECGVTADSEGGQFFADRQGNLVFKDRSWLSTDSYLQEVTADLVAYPHWGPAMPVVDDVPTKPDAPIVCVNDLSVDWSLARLVNFVSLANAGGIVHEYIDEASFKQYGPGTYTRHDFVLLYDSPGLDMRAADIMTGYTQPVLRVNQVSFAPGQSPAWEWTLGVFLNWMVRVWYTHPTNYWGYAVCLHVQSIEHRITPTDWETTLTVDLPESFKEMEWATEYGWDAGKWDEVLWDQVASPVGTYGNLNYGDGTYGGT